MLIREFLCFRVTFSLLNLKSAAKTPQKKKKKGPKAKKTIAAKGRKPRYLKDEKGIWKCTICDETFETKHNYRHHSDTCFKQNDEGFKCGACKEYFTTVDALKGNNIYQNNISVIEMWGGSP